VSENDDHDTSSFDLAQLREQITYLQETLTAISRGGVDAVIIGEPEQEQIYTLTSADRPYRVIVESMGEGAVTVSEHGVILFANPRLAAILGVEPDSMAGRDILSYVREDERAALSALLDDKTTDTRRAELTIARPDGTPVPFLVVATDLDIEGVLVHCLVLSDLTMQKKIEQQTAEEAALAERQRVAREVNDTIVQGLVAAEMALDLGQNEHARAVIASTSNRARNWIGELAGNHLEAGMAIRSTAAQPEAEAP
jgi:PAS domain S-box-containing protein